MNEIKVKIKFGILISLMTIIGCVENNPDNCNLVDWVFVENYDDLNLNLKIAFDDFESINKCARKSNKPILTIYGCIGCFGDPKEVWRLLADKRVNTILQNNFLIRYYHIDNKTPLPDSIISKTEFKTVGDFFLDKQITNYQTNSQPLYAITDWEENDITDPIMGHFSTDRMTEFRDFIIKGKTTYANKTYKK